MFLRNSILSVSRLVSSNMRKDPIIIHNCITGATVRSPRKLSPEWKEVLNEKWSKFNRFNRNFEELSVDKYKELITNETVRGDIQKILDMYEYEKYMTAYVPETLTVTQMQRILAESENKRLELFKYFYKIEMSKRKKRFEKEVKALKEAEKMSSEKTIGIHFDPETNAPLYGLWRQSLFINLTKTTLVKKFDAKLYESTLFGQPLVFDFSYESKMNDKCLNNMCKQIAYAFGVNRTYDFPFSLWFCNLQKDSETNRRLVKNIGNLYPKPGLNKSFINVHSLSYLDFFPKDKLVYLTPDSKEELHVFDVDKVYIIGAFIDLVPKMGKNASIQTAKRLGLETAKLPIDHYTYMKGGKALTLDQMINILNTVKHTKSWLEAFKHIPQRKVKTPEEIAELESRRLTKLKFSRKSLHDTHINIKEIFKNE